MFSVTGSCFEEKWIHSFNFLLGILLEKLVAFQF